MLISKQNHAAGSGDRLRTSATRMSSRAAASLAAIAAMLLLPGLVLADEIKMSGFWVPDATVQGVSDGNIIYTTSTGAEMVRPLAALEGIRITAYPDVAVAQEALDKKDDEAALAALAQVASKSRQPWLKHWANYHRVRALDRLGRPADAARTYVDLTRERGVDPFFLSQPPLKSVQSATEAQRTEIARRLAQTSVRADEVEGLRKLRELVEAPAAEPDQPTTPNTPATPTTPATPDAPVREPVAEPAAPVASDLVLPKDIPANDEVTQLLRAGEFAKALEECDRLLSLQERRLAMRLYQRGIAQIQLAERDNSEKLYKDAGLSFMRVVIYFPRSGYAAPSMIEAGLAHERFGRADLAQRLWQDARVMLDSEAEAAYATRLNQLTGAGDAAANEE